MSDISTFTLGLQRGSYMSVHVLLNLLNQLWQKINCELVEHFRIFRNDCNKFSDKGDDDDCWLHLSYDTKITSSLKAPFG